MSSENTSPPLREISTGACIQALLRRENFGFNAWSATEYARDTDRSCWSPLSGFMQRFPTPFVAKLRKPTVGFRCQPSSYVKLEAYGFVGLSAGA